MFSVLGSIFFFFLFIVLLVLLIGISFIRSLFVRTKRQKGSMSDTETPVDNEAKRDKQRRNVFKKTGEYVDFEEVDDSKNA